jgi:DNA-binding Lrp family transcriptional regulator|tara:strand:- start:31 stop:999 length:969 start_codon:yes stop_codon:yes gene_type:complete
MNLKPSDIKLLNYLYHNNREPLSKIAKATGLSREQVEYKLKKYQSEGIIKQFFTLFNYPKLGYNILAGLLLKIRTDKLEEFSRKFEKDKNVIERGEIFGDYDFYFTLIFKDEAELNEYVSKLFEKNKNIIMDYIVLNTFFSELYPIKFLEGDTKKEEMFAIMPEKQFSEKINLDKRDKIILKMFSEDARVKIVDIAHKLNISPELALYKVRKLEKEKIILGSRMFFDVNKVGYYFADIFLEINNFSTEVQDKIKKFARKHKNIDIVNLLINKPNCMFQIVFKSQEELLNTIKDIKNLFQNDYVKTKILFPKYNEKVRPLPFY